MSDGIRCMWMRGGTSKGAYFLAGDLPADPQARDAALVRIMGGDDARQIDGIGGGDPLTSKVAILSPATRADADVDYLFLQVGQGGVSAAQGCGNILAGVGPAALERGLLPVSGAQTPVRIHMVNTGEVALARVATPHGRVSYAGEARIDGVPGTAAAIPLIFENIAGSVCGALLPTGRAKDRIDGLACTLIDNGMPIVVMKALDFGISGRESREALEQNRDLAARLEHIRLQAGPMMGLGDVTHATVPKMVLVSAPVAGVIATRCWIPHRVHASIGVFAAISVATACTLTQGPAAELASLPPAGQFLIEHPLGATEVFLDIDQTGKVTAAGTLRTARKLFDGLVFQGLEPSFLPQGSPG